MYTDILGHTHSRRLHEKNTDEIQKVTQKYRGGKYTYKCCIRQCTITLKAKLVSVCRPIV